MSRITDRARLVNDIETEDVPLPQWGDGVVIRVKGMDGEHRADFQSAISRAREENEEGNQRAFSEVELDLIILCSFDPDDDSPVFTSDDRTWLWTRSGAVINTLSSAAMRVSGLDTKAEERAGKDSSSPTLTVASSMPSPSN